MKSLNFLALTFSIGLLSVSCNNTPKDSEKVANEINKDSAAIRNSNSKFMTEVASGGMMEVQAGTIAVQKGNSQDVRDFGQRMVDDHSRLNNELKNLAQQKNIVLPYGLGKDEQDNIDKLNNTDAKKFDKTYIDMMVIDHENDVKKFQDMSINSQDPDVKDWASKTLPVLQQHLQMAKEAQAKM